MLNSHRFLRLLIVLLLTTQVSSHLTGCAHFSTKVEVKDINLSLARIRGTILAKLPRGLASTSPNGRTFTSNYFGVPGRFDEDATDKNERSFAVMVILGDRRPYNVSVSVIREKRNPKSPNEYIKDGEDQQMAKELARRVKADLANRREDRNIIDDFRTF